MSSASGVVAPEDQSVTFVELFFDLVFVFSVTQVVSLLHHRLDWVGVGQAVLVFWLVWWAWTQFTWALNAADTTHPWVEFGTLSATAVAFFMAVALPGAFAGQALWFALPYVLVRVIGLGVYLWVAWANPAQRQAVQGFALFSLGGLAAVIAGALTTGTAQLGLWGLAIGLDVVAATLGARAESWGLHPAHFVERHALFVIIALGETLIVAASGVSNAAWTTELLAVAMMAVALTCALWWSYFPQVKPALEHVLESLRGAAQSTAARDVFSLLHFPMLCGIIAYAVAVEEAIAHPGQPLPLVARLALAAGLLLFVSGVALAFWRATHRLLLPRLLLALLTGALVIAVGGASPLVTLALAFAGIATIALLEERYHSPHASVHQEALELR